MSSDLRRSQPDTRALLEQAYARIRALREAQEQAESRKKEPIAVVGIGCRLPGAVDSPEGLWTAMAGRVDAVSAADERRFGAHSKRIAGGFLRDIEEFDPSFFGIAPREAALVDPQQRLLLEVCWEALEDALIPADGLEGRAVGLFAGVSFDDFAGLTLRSGDSRHETGAAATGCARSMGPGRVAYLLGLAGPVMQLDTSCSSSLLAVHLACQSLRAGECELALAGGVNLMLAAETHRALEGMGALAADGRCKAFADAADGYVRGEGCGMVALKRLSDAQADCDRVWAVLRGSAVNHDGRSNGLTAPNGRAQETLLRGALESAAVTADSIDYIEAHGTGTNLGDPIEAMALARVFAGRESPLYLGSLKSNIGHLESAAGVAGLIKAILAIREATVPATLHVDRPNTRIPWDSTPLRLSTETTPWPRREGPRRAGVSSFGMSGTNVHVVVEQAPPCEIAPRAEVRRRSVLGISAKSDEALRELALRYADRIAGLLPDALEDVCFSAGVGRARWTKRLALVGDAGEVAARLRAFAHGEILPEAGDDEELAEVAARFARGDAIDWRAVYPRAVRVGLPHYPYQRVRCWPDAARAARGEWRGSPLLGRRLDSAAIVYEAELDERRLPALGAHEVSGESTVSASMLIEMVAEAAADNDLGGRLTFRDVRFDAPVVLSAGDPTVVQLSLTPEDSGGFAFAVHQRRAEGGWAPRMRGLVGAATTPVAADPQAEGGDPMTARRFYEGLERRAVRLGEPLRLLQSLEVRDGNVSAQIEAAADASFTFDPHVLDAALQSLAAPLVGGEGETLVQAGYERLTLLAQPQGSRFRARARVTGLRGDVRLLDEDGRLLAVVEGVRFAPVSAGDSLIRVPVWRPTDKRLVGPMMPSADELRAAAGAPAELGEYGRALEGLNALAGSYAARALSRVTTPASRYEGLLRRLREIARPELAPEPLAQSLIAAHPEAEAEIELVTRCGRALTETLEGRRDPVELLFPGGDGDATARVYRDSPAGRAMNALLARLARRVADEAGAALRVLEIGGGTGGSTGAVLDALPPGIEYVFTDVSPLFVERARERFGSRPGFRAEVFDVELAPRGLAGFDLVIAANVMHATADLRRALSNVRSAMAPGGRLLLLEGVAPSAWLDVTFGLTEGWWRFADRDLRPHYPLASPAVWRGALEQAGFDDFVAVEPDREGTLRQAVLGAGAKARPGRWYALGEADAVVTHMRAAGAAVVVDALDEEPGVDSDGVVLFASGDASRDCRRLLRLAQARLVAPPPHGLWVATSSETAAGRALWSLVRTIAIEHPELGCRALDVDDPAGLARALVSGRLAAGGAVRVRGGQTLEQELQPASSRAQGALRVSAEGAYLITGGSGGMGRRFAYWLAARGARKLAILSRREPSGEAAAMPAELRTRGVEVLTIAADIGVEAETAAALDLIRSELGPLRGVIHAAGVFRDRLIRDHAWPLFEEVFAAKVHGATHLDRLTRADRLDFFVLCSSAAVTDGAAGLANYVAANAYMDGLAHERAMAGLPALSVNWGPWEGVGMALAVGDERQGGWASAGVAPITADEALRALEELLSAGVAQAAVFRPARRQEAEPVAASSDFAARLDAAPESERPSLVREHVREVVAQALGYQPASSLPLDEGFFRLGMDSLVSLEVLRRLEKSFGRTLPQTLLFAHPTVDTLSAHLATNDSADLSPAEVEPSAPPAAEEESAFLDELERLESLLEERTE